MDARHNLAVVLYRQQKGREALPHLERLLADEPKDPAYRILLAACLGLVGEYGRAIDLYEELLAEHEAQPQHLGLAWAMPCAPPAACRGRRRLPPRPGVPAGLGRGLLEPGQPEDHPLYRPTKKRPWP